MEDMFKVFGEMYKPMQHEPLPAAIVIKSTIKQSELDLLENKIYSLLMESDDMGIGEMGDCRDAARYLVGEWAEETDVEVIHDLLTEDAT